MNIEQVIVCDIDLPESPSALIPPYPARRLRGVSCSAIRPLATEPEEAGGGEDEEEEEERPGPTPSQSQLILLIGT